MFNKSCKGFLWVLAGLMLGTLNSISYAHDIPISTIHIVPDNNEVHLQLVINSFELSFLSEVDQNHNGYVDPEELEVKRALIKRQLLSVLKISMDKRNIRAHSSGIMLNDQNHHLVFRAHYPRKQGFRSLKLVSNVEEITSRSQVTQVTFGTPGQEQMARLEGATNTATFALAKGAENPFWASVFGNRVLMALVLLGLVISGGMYIARKTALNLN